MKVCSRCGRSYEDADRFCQFCGIALDDAPPAPTVTAAALASSVPVSTMMSQPVSMTAPQTTPLTTTPTNPATQKWNALAVLSLITALFGLTVVAIPLGHVALSQIHRLRQKGRGLAIAGLIIGYVVFTFWSVSLIAGLASSHS